MIRQILMLILFLKVRMVLGTGAYIDTQNERINFGFTTLSWRVVASICVTLPATKKHENQSYILYYRGSFI